MSDRILDAIFSRVSTRSFDGEALAADARKALLGAIEHYSGVGLFGSRVRFALAEGDASGKAVKMGTYGLISGAAAYLVAVVTRGRGAMEDLGSATEGVVLEATAAGLSSCWVGGVFDRERAGEAAAVRPDEIVPIVIALGMPAARRRMADLVVTGVSKARSRKAPEELFFGESASGALEAYAVADVSDVDAGVDAGESGAPIATGSETERWSAVLEAVRMAPSASNRQPWRLVAVPAAAATATSVMNPLAGWLFYMAEDKRYNSMMGETKLQNIDMGIAMRHFEEAVRVSGRRGGWSVIAAETASASSSSPVGDEALSKALRAASGRGWVPIASWSLSGG